MFRHTLSAPSKFNKYYGLWFPGVADSLYEYEQNSSKNSSELVEKIKFNLSILCNSIQSAISILKEPFDFERV